MSRTLGLLTLAMVAWSGSLAAQAASAVLQPGQSVRLHQGPSVSYAGILVSAGPDSLTLAIGGRGQLVFLRSSLTGIEIQDGTRSNAGRGAVKGLIIGGGIGFVLGVASAAGQDDSGWFYTPPGQLILGGTLGGAMMGGAIGALIGATSRSPRWVPIVTTTAPARSDGNAGKGVALGMHFEF
jgi:hypothetical protein